MTLVPREELERYTSPLVRELAWCITCAPIVTLCWPPGPFRLPAAEVFDPRPPRVVSDPVHWLREEDILQAWDRMQDHLRRLDRHDNPLRSWMEPVNGARVGVRFERFLHWWFLHDPAITVLAQDIPIVDTNDAGRPGRTIGQIDFVLDWAGEVLHLEVAVKFFLRIGARDQLGRYVGINSRDRMDLKLAHMLHRQRTLSATTVARGELLRRGLPLPDSRRISLRGVLYQPVKPASPANGLVEPRHWWGSPQQIGDIVAQRLPDRGCRLVVLPGTAPGNFFPSPFAGGESFTSDLIPRLQDYTDGARVLVVDENEGCGKVVSEGIICRKTF